MVKTMKTLDDIYAESCLIIKNKSGVNIREKKRERKYVYMRMALANLMISNTKIGISKLSRLMHLDHTTIIFYREEHRHRVKLDEQYYNTYIYVSKLVGGVFEKREDTDLITLLGVMKQTLTFKI